MPSHRFCAWVSLFVTTALTPRGPSARLEICYYAVDHDCSREQIYGCRVKPPCSQPGALCRRLTGACSPFRGPQGQGRPSVERA